MTYAIIYVLIHHISFWLNLYFLNILYFFKYSCTNIFHRRSPCTFYHNILHYNDVIMSAMASQITSLMIVYSIVYSRRRSKKTSKLRVTGPLWPNDKWPVTRKMFPFDDVIMWIKTIHLAPTCNADSAPYNPSYIPMEHCMGTCHTPDILLCPMSFRSPHLASCISVIVKGLILTLVWCGSLKCLEWQQRNRLKIQETNISMAKNVRSETGINATWHIHLSSSIAESKEMIGACYEIMMIYFKTSFLFNYNVMCIRDRYTLYRTFWLTVSPFTNMD